MRYFDYLDTPIGCLIIEENGSGITAVHYCKEPELAADRELVVGPDRLRHRTRLIGRASGQILEYLNGTRTVFNLPLEPEGTEFQKKVWNELLRIPYGETRSYRQIAAACGNEKACRAVGGANHRNPVMIIIPCHRVIGAGGGLTGYACGLDVKERLLAIERGVTARGGLKISEH